jgi:hypothetical protein
MCILYLKQNWKGVPTFDSLLTGVVKESFYHSLADKTFSQEEHKNLHFYISYLQRPIHWLNEQQLQEYGQKKLAMTLSQIHGHRST